MKFTHSIFPSIRARKIVLGLLVFLSGLFLLDRVSYAINTINEGWRLNSNTMTTIKTNSIGGDCKTVVTPNDGKDRFIPTKTVAEWNSFKSAAPALGVTLSAVPDYCPAGSSLVTVSSYYIYIMYLDNPTLTQDCDVNRGFAECNIWFSLRWWMNYTYNPEPYWGTVSEQIKCLVSQNGYCNSNSKVIIPSYQSCVSDNFVATGTVDVRGVGDCVVIENTECEYECCYTGGYEGRIDYGPQVSACQ